MAWIESHEELLTHPKSKRLKRKLNVSIHEVVGILHFFWHWAVRFAEDGDITKFSAEDIADAIQFDGDADQLMTSLIESGFVDVLDDRRIIHDWFDYGGKLILWRRKEAERLKGYRKSKKKEIVHSTNEERTMYVQSTDTVRTPEYSNSNSKSNKDIKPIVDSDECDQLFEQFWKAYPKKDGKEPAKKKWSSYYKKGQIDFAQVMNGLDRYKLFIDHERNVRKFDRQYLSGSTFVNQKHWESEWKIEQPIMGVVIDYKSKAEKDAEQISALKQRIISGGGAYEDVNAARSRIDITTDQNGIPQLQFDR